MDDTQHSPHTQAQSIYMAMDDRAILRKEYHDDIIYFATILKDHLQEQFPKEMMLRKQIMARARVARKEWVRIDIPESHALANAMRYLLFDFEETGIERLASEIWMQVYFSREKGKHLDLPDRVLMIYARELSLLCSQFIGEYKPDQSRFALFEDCHIRKIVAEYISARKL